MDTHDARRLASAWAQGISRSSWPWSDVKQSDEGVSRAMDALSKHLKDMVPDVVLASCVTWQEGDPRALILARGSLMIASVKLEQPEGAPWPTARAAIRRVPLDPATAKIHVESTYRGGWGATARTSRWTFDFADEQSVEIIGEVEEDEEPTDGQVLALELSRMLGWETPAS